MNPIERTAFTWVLAWVLMDSFLPDVPRKEKLEATCVVTLSIGYLYGVHSIFFKKMKTLFIKSK
jgi:hypothetical protein